MEDVYKPGCSGATNVLNLSKYFEEYQKLVGPNSTTIQNEFQFKRPINDLEERCSVSKLTVDGEHPYLPISKSATSDIIHEMHPIDNQTRKLATIRLGENMKLGRTGTKEDSDTFEDNNGEALYRIRVSIYRPFISPNMTHTRRSSECFRLLQELVLPSTTTLKEFANSIKCITDQIIIKKVENVRIGNVRVPTMSLPRSFFIENTFYTEDPTSWESIKQWAEKQNIGTFKTESIDTRIDSINFRLGYSYVYFHQGHCEHILVFSDARLGAPNEVKTLIHRDPVLIQCYLCQYELAKWMVMDSDRLPMRRAFVCTKCCDRYLYDDDGKKLGSFELYPYFKSEADFKHDRVGEDLSEEEEEEEENDADDDDDVEEL